MNSTFASDYFVIQSAFSDKEVLHIAEAAYKSGKRVVLNSVPSHRLRKKLLKYVSIAILDESQISELVGIEILGIESVKIAALKIYGRGADTVIVKMQNHKILIFTEEVFKLIESPRLEVYWNIYERIFSQ